MTSVVPFMIRGRNPFKKERVIDISIYFVLLIFCILIGWRYLSVGLDRDEGNWLYKASKLLVGQVLYRDLPHPKPPALFFTLVPVVLICGTSIVKIRSFVLFLNSITAYFVFLTGRNMGKNRYGVIAGLLCVYLSLHPRFLGYLIRTEIIINLIASIVIYLLISQKILHQKLYLICGVLSMYATLVKQTGVFIFVIILLVILTHQAERSYRLRMFAFFVLGNILGFLPFFVYFILNAALQDFMNQVILLTGPAVGDVASLGARFFQFEYMISKLYGILTLGVLHIVTLPKLDRKNQIIGFWLFFSALFTQITPTALYHHFLIIYPPVAIFAGFGLVRAWKVIRKLFSINGRKLLKESTNLKIITVIMVIFLIAIPLNIIEDEEGANILEYEYQVRRKQRKERAYGGTLTYTEEQLIISFLKQNAESSEKLFVFMAEPQIYYLSGLDPVIPETFWLEEDFLKLSNKEIYETILHPLELNHVRFVFLVNNSHLQSVYYTPNGLLLRNHLTTHYVHAHDIGKVLVYVRSV